MPGFISPFKLAGASLSMLKEIKHYRTRAESIGVGVWDAPAFSAGHSGTANDESGRTEKCFTPSPFEPCWTAQGSDWIAGWLGDPGHFEAKLKQWPIPPRPTHLHPTWLP
jgi:hypothetical protein